MRANNNSIWTEKELSKLVEFPPDFNQFGIMKIVLVQYLGIVNLDIKPLI